MKECPSSMKSFYWYPIVGIGVGIFIYLARFHIIPKYIGVNTNIISLNFHFAFLSTFIYRETGKKLFIKYASIVIFLFLVITIWQYPKKNTINPFAFTNGSLFILCIYYFYYLFKTSITLNLTKNPIFITCCGLLIGTGIIIPFGLMHKYMLAIDISIDTVYLYGSLTALGYSIMNLFFLKALLCITQNK